MKVQVLNMLENCPDSCKDADITTDCNEVSDSLGLLCVRVVIDCEHSGVCAHKGCNAHYAIAKTCAVSPSEVMEIQAALQEAVNVAHKTRPGYAAGAIHSALCFIESGLKEDDALLLAQKIAAYGSVEKWLKARDMKRAMRGGITDGEAQESKEPDVQ